MKFISRNDKICYDEMMIINCFCVLIHKLQFITFFFNSSPIVRDVLFARTHLISEFGERKKPIKCQIT